MSRLALRLAILIFLAIVLLTPAVAQRRAADAPATATAAVDDVVNREMQARQIPGAAVAVVENGAIVLQRAYGLANVETGTPMDVRSIFEIASVTKQFTAAAIMMLVEAGKVRLDDLLSRYVAGTPPAWQRITVRHLLTHSSGLDISAMPQIDGSAPLSVSRAHARQHILQQPMFAPTGRTSWYSDAGYVLLGMVIEESSGQTYREFMTERVFKPLKMEHTSLRDKIRILKGRVSTYAVRDGEVVNWRRESDYEVAAAFGIHSTLEDLARWDASLRGATLLRPESLEQMWTPARLDNGDDARVFMHRYGFGFELADLRGRPTVGHGGASGTYMLQFVDEPLTIIVLTNLESEDRHPRVMARAIAGAVRPQCRPPDMLTPQPDPDATLTKDIQAFLADVGGRRASPVMSPAYAARYKASIGEQAVMAKRLAAATALQYLAQDDLSGRSLWGGEPLSRLVHYSTTAGGRTYFLSVGINGDRQVASFEFQVK